MPYGNHPSHSVDGAALLAPSQSEAVKGAHLTELGLHQLPRSAADLVLHGDLTGRYATGSYSKLGRDRRSVVARPDREGESDHGHRITAAIACHVARIGGTFDQLIHLLMPPDHQGGHHARTIELRSGHARARDYVHRVWANACSAITNTVAVESRQHAQDDLVSLRDRIETTPWRGERGRTALRVLRAHLNFAEAAGGRQHAASERQTAEEAGISRQTLRRAYKGVLSPGGWLRRIRVGHGTEGSTWYLGNGHAHQTDSSASHHRTTQFPPDRDLEEWSTPETAVTADVDSTVISRLMGHDAFAHRGLGSPGLMVIGALYLRAGQTAAELITTASVSRATAYRALQRLSAHGLVHRTGTTWALAPHALDSIDQSRATAPTSGEHAAWAWDGIAQHYATAGIAAQRKALHATERVAYRQALEQLSEHRSKALVIVRDGRQILVPTPRGDEIPPEWQLPGGAVLSPTTGRVAPDWRVATDGRLILITPADQRTYDELVAAHAEAVNEWESAA